MQDGIRGAGESRGSQVLGPGCFAVSQAGPDPALPAGRGAAALTSAGPGPAPCGRGCAARGLVGAAVRPPRSQPGPRWRRMFTSRCLATPPLDFYPPTRLHPQRLGLPATDSVTRLARGLRRGRTTSPGTPRTLHPRRTAAPRAQARRLLGLVVLPSPTGPNAGGERRSR